MEQKSLKKAQAGAFVFAILGLLLILVPFSLNAIGDNMGFALLKTADGKFDFMAILASPFSNTKTVLYGIAANMSNFVVQNLTFLSSFEKIISMVFYYGFIGFWVVCLLLFLFTLLGFINVGFFRFLNKFIALLTGIVGIVLLVITLLYFGLGIFVVGFSSTTGVGIMNALTTVNVAAGAEGAGFLGTGVYLMIVMFIFAWPLTINSWKILARKANV